MLKCGPNKRTPSHPWATLQARPSRSGGRRQVGHGDPRGTSNRWGDWLAVAVAAPGALNQLPARVGGCSTPQRCDRPVDHTAFIVFRSLPLTDTGSADPTGCWSPLDLNPTRSAEELIPKVIVACGRVGEVKDGVKPRRSRESPPTLHPMADRVKGRMDL